MSQKCSYAINAIQAGLHRFYDCHVQLRAKASVPCSSDEFNRFRGLYAILLINARTASRLRVSIGTL